MNLDYDIKFLRTPERLARAAEWEAEQVDQYRANGHTDEECSQWADFLRDLFWTEDASTAHMTVINNFLVRDPSRDESIAYVSALRSWQTATPDEQASYMGGFLGLSTGAAARLLEKAGDAAEVAKTPAEQCALYRYFDGDGELLYVGISVKPTDRDVQHRSSSKWYQFVADRQVECFETASEAKQAERAAIRSERPLFNKTHNVARRDRAVEYLLNKVAAA